MHLGDDVVTPVEFVTTEVVDADDEVTKGVVFAAVEDKDDVGKSDVKADGVDVVCAEEPAEDVFVNVVVVDDWVVAADEVDEDCI